MASFIIIGRSFEEHLNHLHAPSFRLPKVSWSQDTIQQWPFSTAKDEFPRTRCFFRRGLPRPPKMSKVKEWSTPKLVIEVQQFLGLTNYYRCFVKDFATLAKPYIMPQKRTMYQGIQSAKGLPNITTHPFNARLIKTIHP